MELCNNTSKERDIHLCSVVIPVYKETLDKYEELSFRQCLKILQNYPIILVTYQKLNLSRYDFIAKEYNIQLQRCFFQETYFCSVKGYNDLLMQKSFYQTFKSYQFILIYQLDAFVFKDELAYWCNQGYDYIGAPWLDDHPEKIKDRSIWRVGNGGLSLRKVDYFIKVLSWRLPLEKIRINNYFKYSELKKIPYIFGWKNTVRYYQSLNDKMNEDVFFTNFLRQSYLPPKLPTVEVAAYFAFEKYPSYMYECFNHHLPFGCHAFLKYEYNQFWKKYIEET